MVALADTIWLTPYIWLTHATDCELDPQAGAEDGGNSSIIEEMTQVPYLASCTASQPFRSFAHSETGP